MACGSCRIGLMGTGLSPEQRQIIEEFLRSELPEGSPQPLRERHAAARRIAELIIQVDGPDGTPEHRRLLAKLLADQPVAPWSWIPIGTDAPHNAWTDERVPTSPIERHHQSSQ
jgi:hypothetical protein